MSTASPSPLPYARTATRVPQTLGALPPLNQFNILLRSMADSVHKRLPPHPPPRTPPCSHRGPLARPPPPGYSAEQPSVGDFEAALHVPVFALRADPRADRLGFQQREKSFSR